MKKLSELLTILVAASALFLIQGCDNGTSKTTGDNEPIADNDAASSDTDNTGDTSDTANTGNTANTGDTSNTGNTGNTGDTSDTDETGDTSDTGTELDKFSFFITSLVAIRELSGDQNGFGGDLRYGETGAGAGLRGADKICAEIAERSMPGSSVKQWRAFLSATADENGDQVNAIDRIGEGPWYDRLGRLVANNKSELLNTRPVNADPAIINDLPNEDGVPNHRPDPTQPEEDNHHMLTGSNQQGTLYSATSTCNDWTSSSSNSGKPYVGLSWPRDMAALRAPGGGGSSSHWMSAMTESGCAAGVTIIDNGAGTNNGTVGSGGGYGGFYCFALVP